MKIFNIFGFTRLIEFDKKSLIRFSPLLALSFLLISLSIINPPIFQGDSSKKTPKITKVSANNKELEVSTDSAASSVKIETNDSVKNSGTQEGVCTVTKNGKTETVPSDSVKVDEKSSGDINVKVDCKTKSNSTNNTSINNNVDVQVNSSN